jgi:hypothetical protein
MFLAEELVERDEIGLDRGGDDVRAAGFALVLALATLTRDEWRRDPHVDDTDRIGALAERVDVVGEQPWVPVEHLGDGVVDGPVERVDRADPFGRCLPMVLARVDDHGAPAPGIRAR